MGDVHVQMLALQKALSIQVSGGWSCLT